MRCPRCGGHSIAMLGEGLARCKDCGFDAPVGPPNRLRHVGQAFRNIWLVVITIAGAEMALGATFGTLTHSIREDIWQLWFWTGLGALLLAGMYAGGTKAGPGTWVSMPDSIPNRHANFIGWLAIVGAILLALGLVLGFGLP